MRGVRYQPNRRSFRGGFTLVEVLISMALLATMMAMLWTSFASSFRTRDLATENYNRLRAVQVALRRMQREISMAFVTKIGQIPTNDDQEITYQTAFIGINDRMDFSAFAHVRTRVDEVASEQAEIAYFVRAERGADGQPHDSLVRREQAPIDGEPEEGGTIMTLLRDVRSVEFEYWEPDREIAGESWAREWDTRDNYVQGLPPRVRITIEIAHPIRNRETLSYQIEAEIHLSEPIGFAVHGTMDATQQVEEILLEEVLDESSDDPPEGVFDN